MGDLRRVLMAAACLLAALPARAGQPGPAPWWNRDWRYRKILHIRFPQQGDDLPVDFFAPSKLLGERTLTGKAVIETEGKMDRPNKELVVTDEKGTVVPSRAYASGWGRKVTVLFRAEPRSGEYYLYYGNPAADRARQTWRRSAYPILMVTVPVDGPRRITDPAQASKALLQAERERGKIGTYSVNNPVNPFGLEYDVHYITLYSGLMYAPLSGTYQFAVDAGGTAHFVVDGNIVLTARGGAKPAQDWAHKTAVKLGQGIHSFAILHGERLEAQGIRVGWRQPGQDHIRLMTGSAFARSNYAPAELVGFEDRDKEATPFFAVERSDVAFKVPGKADAMARLKLRNLTRGEGLTYHWAVELPVTVKVKKNGVEAVETEMKKREFEGPGPRCFVEAGGKGHVTLEVFKGDRSLGTYARQLDLRGLRLIEAEATSELVRCPNIIYEGERATLTFTVANLCKNPLPVRYERLTSSGRTSHRDVELAAAARGPVQIRLPVPPPDKNAAEVTFRLSIMGVTLGETTVRVVRPGSALADVKPKLGHLVDADGRRTVVMIRTEVQADHRRWALLKWAAGQFRDPPKKVLLFGDPMLNVRDNSGGEGYVDALRKALAGKGRSLTFVENSANAPVPCVADVPAFAAVLAEHQPELVILSPGSRDAIKGVARQEFARSLDVMIDLARAQDRPPAILFVTPPPLVSNRKLSEGLATAARIIAEQHRLPCVDLHASTTRDRDWKDKYKQHADDDVYYLYPNPATQKAFAAAIARQVE